MTQRGHEIAPGIHWVGALDPDRRQFDALTPLPEGTSYNSYLVQGRDKTVLLDTVEPARAEEFFARLDSLAPARIDLVVSHHAEQDHSGLLPEILRRHPEARLLVTPKAKKILLDLLDIPADRVDEVQDDQRVDLGGRTLRFIHAPWVHWPETMLSYLEEDRLLFSGDLFGSHLATHDLFLKDEPRVYQALRRYYAEIMSPFRGQIRRHLQRLEKLDIAHIAPSHGPLHARPAAILDAYRAWVRETPEDRALLVYTSMHGSTQQMVSHLSEALLMRGVPVEVINVEEMDAGRLCMAAVDVATLVIASPMVLAGPHPKAVYAAALVHALRPKVRHIGVIGSFGWGGRLVETFTQMLGHLKAEFLPQVVAMGRPGVETFEELDRLADLITEKHAALFHEQQPEES